MCGTYVGNEFSLILAYLEGNGQLADEATMTCAIGAVGVAGRGWAKEIPFNLHVSTPPPRRHDEAALARGPAAATEAYRMSLC